jgi:hypothetical protein
VLRIPASVAIRRAQPTFSDGRLLGVVMEGTLCRYMQQQGARRVDIVFGCPAVR